MRYQVQVFDGHSYVGNRRCVARDCGHKHRSESAADACLTRLLDYHCDHCGRRNCRKRSHGNRRVWSAEWHGACVVEVHP